MSQCFSVSLSMFLNVSPCLPRSRAVIRTQFLGKCVSVFLLSLFLMVKKIIKNKEKPHTALLKGFTIQLHFKILYLVETIVRLFSSKENFFIPVSNMYVPCFDNFAEVGRPQGPKAIMFDINIAIYFSSSCVWILV